jgi:hypothetical protein
VLDLVPMLDPQLKVESEVLEILKELQGFLEVSGFCWIVVRHSQVPCGGIIPTADRLTESKHAFEARIHFRFLFPGANEEHIVLWLHPISRMSNCAYQQSGSAPEESSLLSSGQVRALLPQALHLFSRSD